MQFGAVPAKVMLAFGNRIVFEEAPEREAQVRVESRSVIVTAVPFEAVFLTVDLSVTSETTGGSLTDITDKSKIEVATADPLLTENETCAFPFWFAFGEIVPLQSGAVPANATAPVFEISAGLLDT